MGCQEVKEIKTYTVYRSMVWEDVNLHGMEKNLQGFSEDLFLEIAKNEGFKIEFVTVHSNQMLRLLKRKGVDIVLTTETVSTKDEKRYQFSDPFFTYGPVLMLRAGETLEDFKALKLKQIGFSRSVGQDLMTREDLGYVFTPYDATITAIDDLIAGRVDAVIVDSIYGNQLAVGLYSGKIKIAAPLFKIIRFRAATSQDGNKEFIALFNQGLEKLKKSDAYAKMLTYWSLYEPTQAGAENQV